MPCNEQGLRSAIQFQWAVVVPGLSEVSAKNSGKNYSGEGKSF